MSKKAGRNKTSWRTKTMAALALSAAFGLSAGPALAENVTDLSWNPHDATPNAGKIITGDDFTITGTVGAAGNIEMTGGTLTVGDLIFNASGIVAPGAGDLSFGSGEKLIFKGGKIVADTITIGGTAWNVLDLSQGGFANQANATNLTLRIGGNASTAPNSISTQKLDYYATPGMLLQNTTIELTGTGVLNWIPSDFNVEVPSGYNGGSTLQAYEDIDPSPTVDLKNLHSRLVMTGGTLNMDASQMDGYGRLIELSSVDISSGTVNIGGYYTTTVTDFNDDYNPSTPATTKANAKFSSVLYGRISAVDDMFRIRGNAEINLHDYGNIGTFYSTTGGTPFVMSIEGGTINMLGGQTSASLIRASSAFTDRAGASAASNAKLSISGGEIKVADGNYGAILSRDTNMSGGTITVGGTLMVAGGMNWRYNADVFEDIAALNTYDTMNTTALQWGDFKFNGGTISIASTGIVDFATGNVDFYAQGGTFGGKLTLTDTVPGSPTDAQKGILYAKTVIVNPNKTFTVSDLSITDTDSTITVNGRLIVTGDVITAGTDVNIGSNLSIAQGGTLVAQLDKVLERANESASWTLQGNNSTLADALTGSTGLINFLSATGYNYTKNQKAQIASDLGLETGQLIFENGTLTDGDTSAVTDGSAEVDVDNVVTDTNTELVIDTTASSSATDVTLTSTGGDVPLQSKTITIDSTAVDTVNIETTVILSGAGTGENTPLVADGNGDAIETLSVDGGAIQLGVAGSSAAQGGTVGNIEFTGTGGTLSVDDGTFNAGAISTDGTIAGAVDIAVASTPGATSTLTTDGIDLDTTGGVKIDLSSAVLNNTTGGIKVGGDTSTAATSHELILTNAAVDNGSGSIVFGNTTSSGDNKLTMDAGSILETGAITFGTVTSGNNELTVNTGALAAGAINFGAVTTGENIFELKDTGAAQNTTGAITFGDADANTMTVAGANLTTNGGDILFNGNTANTLGVVDGTLMAGDIKGNNTKAVDINVGDATAAGHLVASSVTDGVIIVDPAWGTPSGPSTAILGAITTTSLGVYQNSWAALGWTDPEDVAAAEAWMLDQIPGGELAENGYTAALTIVRPMEVGDTNWLVVDGNPVTGPASQIGNQATFAADSLLLVDAARLDGGVALTALGATPTAIVNAGATLKIVGGIDGQNVKILAGFTNTTGVNGWGKTTTANPDTLLTDSPLLDAIYDATPATGTNVSVTLARNSTPVTDIFPELSSGLNGMVDTILTSVVDDGTNPGISYVYRLFRGFLPSGDGTFDPAQTNGYGITADQATRTLEGAARLAVVAGAPAVTNSVMTKASTLIVDHNNMLNDTQPAYGNEPGGLGLWLSPFYGMSDVDGQGAGKFENAYEVNYGGAALGLDYNISEAFRLGLALSVGGGDSESQSGGDFNKTENDFDFFGVSLYGSYTNGAFGLTGDVGYTAVDNDIEQRTPDVGFGGRLKSTVDSDAFTVGLTGQYRFVAGENLNVTPHLGLRYSKISTDDADVKAGAAKLLNVATEDQNLFQIPLGVKFSSDMVTDGGWTVTPSADLGVLFTMGDTDIDSKVRIPNTTITGRTNTDAVDSAAFQGALGLQAKADNGLTLGLEYGLLASGNQTDHSISGLLRFDF